VFNYLVKILSNKKLQIAQLLLFACFLGNQHYLITRTSVQQYPLPQPVVADNLRMLTLGEAAIAATLLCYWLIGYDSRAGEIVLFEKLDYGRLSGWLETISDLDPLSDYSSMVAAGVFIEVKDRQRQLAMIALVRRLFMAGPEVHWRWMAQAVMFSKYRLLDLPLALSLARELREAAQGKNIPDWASELEAYLLHDLGELEAALLLIGTMIEEGTITDPDELRFLNQRILELEEAIQAENQADLSVPQQN
jgi:hypothetical protein